MKEIKRSKGLSVAAAITFAVGTMIGSGVFVLSGLVVNAAGPGALLSYVICAVLVSFSGLSYAMLASIFPEDGGGYLYAEKLLGKYPGFLAGWIMYIAQPIVLSFVLLSFGIYMNLLLSINLDPRIFAMAALLLITYLNMRGVAEAGKFEVTVVAAKVTILVVFSLVGLLFLRATSITPLLPGGVGPMLSQVSMVFFAYMGFQVITMMGGEVKQSSKSVPVAMLASILIVAVIYIGVILGLLAADLPTYGSESIFDAASVIMGPVGGSIIALGAVLSTLSSANALTAGASRIIKEMASEEQIPGRFARLRHQEPTNALLLGFCISAVFILYGSLDAILGLVNVAMLIAMVFVNISALKLVTGSHIETNKAYFRVPFGPLFPLLATASCLLMLFTLPLQSIVLGVIALFLGTILYSLEDTPLGKEEITKIRVLLRREIEEEIRPDKS